MITGGKHLIATMPKIVEHIKNGGKCPLYVDTYNRVKDDVAHTITTRIDARNQDFIVVQDPNIYGNIHSSNEGKT